MLTDTKIRSLTPKSKTYKISAGGGLFLAVSPTGGRHWRFRYYFAGREKSLSLGEYPAISLTSARTQSLTAHGLLTQGIDPSLKRQADKRNLAIGQENTFKAIAEKWFEANRTRWLGHHSSKIWRRLEMHAIPSLGKMPVNQIKPLDLLAVLQKVEQSGSTETTHRVLWLCNRVFKYAVVIGATESNPALNIGTALKPNRGGSLPVIDISELPKFLRRFEDLRAREQDKLAFRLLLLTA